LNILYDLKIDSVFIEGGAKVLSEFYDFADKFHIFLAPKIFSNGISPFQYLNKKNELKIINTKNFEDNIYLEALRCLPE
jgi:diaminohydroxyphosphoribosylaminopyrimidine deaminase/5-amino-6-(5-phosphoribosylamino)uracil reductase